PPPPPPPPFLIIRRTTRYKTVIIRAQRDMFITESYLCIAFILANLIVFKSELTFGVVCFSKSTQEK
ncbi:hypothetical protein ACVGV8_11915, partial [Enterobacter intestinihominis]